MAQGSATGGRTTLAKTKIQSNRLRPAGNVIPIRQPISHPRDIRMPVGTTLTQIYPVGSIYMSDVSTDPNTLLGFGTWVAIQSGIWITISSVNIYLWHRTA